MWDQITYLFTNFNGAAVEVWVCIGNLILHFAGQVITYLDGYEVNPSYHKSLTRSRSCKIVPWTCRIASERLNNSKSICNAPLSLYFVRINIAYTYISQLRNFARSGGIERFLSAHLLDDSVDPTLHYIWLLMFQVVMSLWHTASETTILMNFCQKSGLGRRASR